MPSEPPLEISDFVQECAAGFLQSFPQLQPFARFRRYEDQPDRAEFVVEPPAKEPGRFRSRLVFLANDKAVCVSLDGCHQILITMAGLQDGHAAAQSTIALFGEILHDRKVALSCWSDGECIAADFTMIEEARKICASPGKGAWRARSWSGAFDYDDPAWPGA